jgi:hypothetical protein
LAGKTELRRTITRDPLVSIPSATAPVPLIDVARAQSSFAAEATLVAPLP